MKTLSENYFFDELFTKKMRLEMEDRIGLGYKTYGINKNIAIKITNKSNIYENNIYISIPHIKQDIPIFIIFRALGCLSDKEIMYFIIDNDNSETDNIILKILHKSLLEVNEYRSENESINYISSYNCVDNSSC